MDNTGIDHDWLLFVDTAMEVVRDLHDLLRGTSAERLPEVVQLIQDVAEACKYIIFYYVTISWNVLHIIKFSIIAMKKS